MKVFRGKALLVNAPHGHSPTFQSSLEHNVDLMKEGAQSPLLEGDASQAEESDYKSIEQQEMSLRKSLD